MDNKPLDCDDLIGLEQARIGAQRELRKQRKVQLFNEEKKMGLAISGGGIRSASFALGLLQALNGVVMIGKSRDGKIRKGRVFEQLDYLSTVSGGGYIGSALTWFNQQYASGDTFYFPFGRKFVGARTDAGDKQGDILNFIRQHGDYLVPGEGLSFFSALMVVLRSMVVSFLVYFVLLVLAFQGLILAGVFDPVIEYGFGASMIRFPNWVLLGAAGLGLLFVLVCVLYALGTYLVRWLGNRRDYSLRVRIQRWLGYLGSVILALLVAGTVPLVASAIDQLALASSETAGAGASLLGVIGGAYQFMQQHKGKASGAFSGTRIILTCLLLIYGFALLAYGVAGQLGAYNPVLVVGVLALLLATAVFVNLNYFNLGRMYRDRLIETFLPNRDAVSKNLWQMATESDRTRLHQVNGDDQQGPLHLVNTNVILIDSIDSKFRGRGGDNFVLSAIACGSDATRGWMRTEHFDRGNMTLATAMAISGAAANPNTGVAGRGLMRSKAVSFLMFLLGVRLGYYVANPDKEVKGFYRFLTRWLSPNYIYPGIRHGLFGRGFNTRAGYLELSDGGHFENLGLYELIRRRLDLIIVSDAGADPEFSFQDLANAVEKVRVDFGAVIRFDEGKYDLRHLMPGSAGKSLFVRRYDLARRGFAIAQIHYGGDDEKIGTLLYVKTTMTKKLPADVYGYKDAHPSFPDQSTADQFFDESQFEAYRELGYQIGKSMLRDDRVNQVFEEY